MAEDEIRQRVTVDADQAQRELKETSRAEQELAGDVRDAGQEANRASTQNQALGDSTRRAGDQADAMGQQTRGLRGRIAGLTTAVKGMVGAWLTFEAMRTLIVGVFQDIANASERAHKNVKDLGDEVDQLAGTVGGRRADQLIPEINEIALESNLGPEGRDQLIGAAELAARANPRMSNERLLRRVEQAAQVARATPFTGEEAFQTTQAIADNLNVGFGAAADRAAVLGRAGFEADDLREVVGKFGSVEGERTLALMLAARRRMRPEQLMEGVETLRDTLSQRDEEGRLAEELRNVGLSGDQSFIEKIAALNQGVASGQISQTQLEQVGGIQEQATIQALGRSLPELDQSLTRLRTGSAEQFIERKRESELVQAAERARKRELREEIASEQFAGSEVSETLEERRTRLRERGGGSEFLGFIAERGMDVIRGTAAVAGFGSDEGDEQNGEPENGEQGREDGEGEERQAAVSQAAATAMPPVPTEGGDSIPFDEFMSSGRGQTVINNYTTNVGTMFNNASDPRSAGLDGDSSPYRDRLGGR